MVTLKNPYFFLKKSMCGDGVGQHFDCENRVPGDSCSHFVETKRLVAAVLIVKTESESVHFVLYAFLVCWF